MSQAHHYATLINMRTTVDLSEEAYQAVKAIARDRDESMGKVMSELILKGAHGPADLIGKMRDFATLIWPLSMA